MLKTAGNVIAGVLVTLFGWWVIIVVSAMLFFGAFSLFENVILRAIVSIPLSIVVLIAIGLGCAATLLLWTIISEEIARP